jgi:site-specific DNA recombinase
MTHHSLRPAPGITTARLCGLLICGICQRQMQGSWNNDKPHYRCVYPTEYGLANTTAHPRSIYLREEQLIPSLDHWLVQAFAPNRLSDTVAAMATGPGRSTRDRAGRAGHRSAACHHRL